MFVCLFGSISFAANSGSCTASVSCGGSDNDFVSCTSDNNDCKRFSNGVKCDGEFTGACVQPH